MISLREITLPTPLQRRLKAHCLMRWDIQLGLQRVVPPGGGGILGLMLAGYLRLASQSPYPIIVYFWPIIDPILVTFWKM